MSTPTNKTPSSVEGLFNEEEIAALKEGAVISKNYKQTDGGALKPTTSVTVINADEVKASAGNWGSAPRITAPGGSEARKISRPSKINDAQGNAIAINVISSPNIGRYNVAKDEQVAAERKAEEAAREELAAMSPQALHDTVRAMSRQMKRLQKEMADLKKGGSK